MPDIKEILTIGVQKGASDLHLAVDAPPVLRIHGILEPMRDYSKLTSRSIKDMIYGVLNDAQREKFEEELDLDCSLYLSDIGRFRTNIYMARGNIGVSLRFVPLKIKTIEELGLPNVIAEFCRRQSGLVLVTGPTGSGKTSTLAAMVDLVNNERNSRIIIIEDPIEYIHRHKKSMIIQREVYLDSHSFSKALRQCLRQDPDIICVGEMRDLETISTVLTAAETGHLVFSTLHTPDAVETINRIIDVFPPYQQEQIRIQLSSCLQAVVAQKLLLPRKEKKGRVPATEILVANTAVRNLIRQKTTEQISSIIQTSTSVGMHSMDKSVMGLYQNGLIDKEVAISELRERKSREYLESLPKEGA